MKTTVKYYGVPLTVEYTIQGRHFDATHYDPAEEPYIEIKSICA